MKIRSFNPRSHEGSDRVQPGTCPWWTVSIHAPTRGATGISSGTGWFWESFNPRSHEGSDALFAASTSGCGMFQSTLPRGERQQRPARGYVVGKVSIHAPTRGATGSMAMMLSCFISFNPRSHEGSDGRKASGWRRHTSFNPRSHEGSDVCRNC